MKRFVATLAFVLLVAGAPHRAQAAQRIVKPGPATLQAALDAAQDGDEIVIQKGVYEGNFTRSNITNLFHRAPDGDELIFDDEVVERVRAGGHPSRPSTWNRLCSRRSRASSGGPT
jgi:hypothetical protein